MSQKRILTTFAALVIAVASFAGSTAGARSDRRELLDIDPIFQQTPLWCWAAVGEMVFRYYNVGNVNPAGNFQCGIIALLHPVCNQNCGSCVVGAGNLSTMDNMLTRYPVVAAQVTGSGSRISTLTRQTPLTQDGVETEIDAGRPVVAGISPSGYQVNGVSQHVALIVGYEDDEVIVNDPFPFGPRTFTGNPYLLNGGEQLAQGQYQIPLDRFTTRLRWRETIYRIRCSGRDCDGSGPSAPTPEPQLGRSCQTQYGTCGPFYNQPALPIGSACWCQSAMGPLSGRVVR